MIRTALCLIVFPLCALAESSMTIAGDLRCIASDGLPDHTTGQFPNSGNPHRLKTQSIRFCVDATPNYSGQAREVETIGIATNGIIIRPGTADWYDANSRRGHSRNDASGWNLDGMGAAEMLGLDHNNAHVDHRGLYHYHGIAESAVSADSTLVGWAADGFEIHYVGDQAQSSYQLKAGIRSSAPGGSHDGTYVQDWAYVSRSGNLDECNGAMVNGIYTYSRQMIFRSFHIA